MKNILILAFILAAQIAFGQPVRYNSLTTNQEHVALGVVTNIANTYATNGTNFALSIGANGTNYTLLTGANGTNFSLLIGTNGTNFTVATSNGLYAQISVGGVSASQATNIAQFQAQTYSTNNTNWSNLLSQNGSNYVNVTSNNIWANFSGPTNGITAATATNIAQYQANIVGLNSTNYSGFLATNLTFGWSNAIAIPPAVGGGGPIIAQLQ